jgi:hypothetical protein
MIPATVWIVMYSSSCNGAMACPVTVQYWIEDSGVQ